MFDHFFMIWNLRIGFSSPVHICDLDNSLALTESNRNGTFVIGYPDDDTFYYPSLLRIACRPFLLKFLHERFNGFRRQVLKRPPVSLTLVKIPQALFQSFLGDLLHVDVGSRIYLQTVVIEGVGSVFLLDVLSNVFSIKRDLLDEPIAAWLDVQNRVNRFGGFTACSIAFFDHPVEDVNLALFGPLRMFERRIPAGGLGKAGKHGTLGKVHIFGGFAKIVFGCRFHTVCAVAQIDLIEVKEQNLLFSERFFDSIGEYGFLHLTSVTSLR